MVGAPTPCEGGRLGRSSPDDAALVIFNAEDAFVHPSELHWPEVYVPEPVRLEFSILSLNPGLRQRCVASDLLQRGTQPRVVEGPHAVDLRRRTHSGPCRAEQCPLGLPLPGLGPAPSGGLTTNSRRTRFDAGQASLPCGGCLTGPRARTSSSSRVPGVIWRRRHRALRRPRNPRSPTPGSHTP